MVTGLTASVLALGLLALPRPGQAGAEVAVVQAAASRLDVRGVSCRNLTTGQSVRAAAAAPEWDCGELGLEIGPGDEIVVAARGATSLDVADLDADDDLDIIGINNREDRLIWLVNDGRGMFDPRTIDASSDTGRPLALDLDGDGDVDIVSDEAASEDALAVYVNDGGATPSFDRVELAFVESRGRTLASGLLTQDGLVDLVWSTGSSSGIPLVWLENLSGEIPAVAPHPLPYPEPFPLDPVLADFDGDGDLDVFGADDGLGPVDGSIVLENRLTVGGWVVGIVPERVRCVNVTTGGTLQGTVPGATWDCEDLGLSVEPGDRVQMEVRGPARRGETADGARVGLRPAFV